jgi:Xaa-Pro dipeptidase
LDVLPAARYLRYVDLLAPATIVDVFPTIARLRARKSPGEVACVRLAGEQVKAAFTAAEDLVGRCATDLEIQIELERVLRRSGHQGPLRFRGLNGLMFYGAVLAGADGAVPPWADTPLGGPGPNRAVGKGPGGWRIRDGDAITVDLVGAADGYVADATRTFFRGAGRGPLPQALAVCEGILAELETMLCPGVPAEDLFHRGGELAEQAGFGENWMGCGSGRVRFVGHGVGLEVNERPFLAAGMSEPLAEGNVIAVEPKLVFPEIGAVGVENTYLVTGGEAPERLT